MDGLAMYPIWEWLMFFYFYCFVGWVWESCYVSVKKRRWVNRGFLKGPLLPIYGSGALCILGVAALTGSSPWATVLAGTAAATLLEYVTGAVMEALFKVRYWDYSSEVLNLNGYICLKSVLCWAVMTGLLVYVIHPPVAAVVGRLDGGLLYSADLVITAWAAADFATSFKAAMDFRDVLAKAERLRAELGSIQNRLEELERQLSEASARRLEEIREAADRAREAAALSQKSQELRALRQEFQLRQQVHRERLQAAYSRSIHGLLKRNPGAVSRKHKDGLEEIRRVIQERVRKDRKKK